MRPIAFSCVALLVGVLAPLTSHGRIDVFCRDGSARARVTRGAHIRHEHVCDMDGAVDGVCTLDIDPLVHPTDPSPIGPELCHFPPVGVGVAAPRHGTATRVVQRRPRVVVHCRVATRSAPTTTLPPTDLTGTWRIAETRGMSDCPADIEGIISRDLSVTLVQDGTTVGVCGPAFIHSTDAVVTPGGFTADSGRCCGMGHVELFDYAQRLTVSPTASPEELAFTNVFDMSSERDARVTCRHEGTGTMTRVRTPCAKHADCLRIDACSRCVAGSCELRPRCPR